MFEMNPITFKDFYKAGHPSQYPKDLTLCVNNMTPRGSRVKDTQYVLPFAQQYYVEEYLIRQFNRNFFQKERDGVLKQYKRLMDYTLGPDSVPTKHIGELHELGYLPLRIKAVPEGTRVPLRVPFMTSKNTDPHFGWLPNTLETLQSNILWQPLTSLTTADGYFNTFLRYAERTGAAKEFIPWQGHDFSMRGMPGLEAAILSGAAHLASGFTGTDTIPAIPFLEEYYGANIEKEMVGGSVPALEHSIVCMGGEQGEIPLLVRLLTEVYPKDILSFVWDTWDFWGLLQKLRDVKEVVLNREGKLVVRPDSGDPVDIICGTCAVRGVGKTSEEKGAIEVLWDIFGGTQTQQGFDLLDSHIGLIYGDSITPERQRAILARLALKGFASSNVVLGIGSYTYQYVTRDTYGQAIKATYGATESRGEFAIFKKPKTDDGTKNSAKGLLKVYENPNGEILCLEECTWEQESEGLLRDIFVDGKVHNVDTLANIRARIAKAREKD